MTDITPTDEQTLAVDLAIAGDDLAIQALAGTGKTTTLTMIAEQLETQQGNGGGAKTGYYLAFNKAIATDARQKMPNRTTACTVHKLAYDKLGIQYSDRMSTQVRYRYRDMASQWSARRVIVHDHLGEATSFSAAAAAGYAVRTVENFCRSADEEIGRQHVPRVEKLDKAGKWDNNNEFSRQVLPTAQKAWEDVQDKTKGMVWFTPGHFLKLWQLTHPHIHTDFILYDEAQDANPVMLDIVSRQDHTQRIFVGDPNQQIYAWTGAVDAMDSLDGERCQLTRSFRFGPEVAEVANLLLEELGAEARIVGAGGPTRVGTAAAPDVVLCRTNAQTVALAFQHLAEGQRVGITGGVHQVVAFAKAARDLMDKGWTSHQDLAVFKSWVEVLDFCADPSTSSGDMDGLVKLVEEFGTTELVAKLHQCKDPAKVSPAAIDITLGTAHKSKGLEWPQVRLGGDFADPVIEEVAGSKVSDAERQLLYVAVTRAQRVLDVDLAPWLDSSTRYYQVRQKAGELMPDYNRGSGTAADLLG